MTAPVIMVIRHAEKPADALAGVQLDGTQDPDALIVQGWQRAGALAVLFDPARGSLQSSALVVPEYLFAAKYEPAKHSKRPFETIQPLAARLGLTINDEFKVGDCDDLVGAALSCAGPVLISWQHEEIPLIGNTITGNSTTVPQKWPGDRFDVVWLFTPQANGYAFTQLPELLLAGDQSSVIS